MRGLRASFALVVLLVAAGLPSSAARGEGSAQLAAGRGVNGSMGGRQAPATGQVTAHDGSFWLGGKPILLRGIKVTVGGQSLADFQRFASWGANFVRMRVQWAFLEPDPPVKNRDGTWTHTYDASYVDEVVQSIAWAQQSGLYVMVSSHKCGVDEGDESCPYFGFPGWLYQAGYNSHGVTYPETDDGKLQAQTDFWSDSLRQQFYRDMFGYMVRQIDGEDGIVGYELMNEPQIGTLDNSHTTTQMVLDWQLSLAKMARNIDPARVITFTTRSGDAMGLPMADLSGWNALGNVALDVHDYHGARWGSGMNMNNQSADYGEVSGVLANHVTGDTAYLGTVFGHVNFLQVRRSFLGDIPMWVGEMGDSDVDPGVTVYFATVLAAVNSLGLTWTVDGGGAQGFINADDTLKPWGQLVLDALADGGHSPVATDNFTRSVANGWGTASSGQAWTTVGGPASDYAVNGSVGTMNLPTTNSPRMAYLGAPLTDQEVLVRFSVDRAPSTMRVIAQAVGRYDPTAKSFYTIGAGLVWDGSVRINATKRVGGSETIVGTEASLGKIAASGTWYWLRAQFVNEGASVRLKARAWKDGSSEPPTWQFSYLDSTNPLTGAGDPGLRTMPWATDVPFVLSFDDLTDKPI